jgi:eukaryotic-like serine/threonine-protein kinase
MSTQPDAPTWSEIEPYLDQVLDAPEADRTAMLQRLDAEQPAIAAALRGFLSLREELAAKGFLEGAAVIVAADSLIGMQVGTYTIHSLLGRGGMGQVWLAQRSDGRFEGQVAIKFLDSYAASPVALERFRREGRLLARLTHAHIARLLDAGVNSEGRPYLVLEYVDGERIDRYCDAHALDIPARLRLVLDVLSAVMHAHRNLVVHRDIKPSNVLVAADGTVKLLDFGVAKMLNNDPASGDTAPTRLEDTALTPEYAAPEQILGEAASTATDVYQLGVLLFVLLTGRLPFDAPQSTRAEKVRVALEVEPPRLSDVAAPELRKKLRGDLDAIVAKALRKVPTERYSTAAALADDLRRYLTFEPVAARADALGYRVRKFARRYRSAVIGSSAAVAALIAVTIFALIQMREAQLQRDQSRIQERRAQRQAEFVGLMMSTVGGTPTTAVQLLETGVKLLDKHYPDDPAFQAASLMNLAGRYQDLGANDKAFPLTQKAAALAHQLNDQSLIARSECGLAGEEAEQGHMNLAADHLALGEAALARLPNSDVLGQDDCLENRMLIADAQGDTGLAIRLGSEAIALLEKAGETHDVRYSSVLGNIADYYAQAGDRRTSFEFVERSLAAAQRNGQSDTDSATTQEHNLASALYGFGEVKQSCDREGPLIARMETSGREIIAPMAGLYALCLVRMNKNVEALLWAERAVAAADRAGVLSSRIYARLVRERTLIEAKRMQEATAEFTGIDDLLKNQDVALRFRRATAAIAHADLMARLDRLDQAALEIAAEVAKLRVEPDGVVLLPNALLNSARIALLRQRYAETADYAQQALSAYIKGARDPNHSADVGAAALRLAQARVGLNDVEGAHESARQAVISLAYALGEDAELTKQAVALR